MEITKKLLEKVWFCMETVGIELLEITPRYAKARLPIGEKHLNGLGTSARRGDFYTRRSNPGGGC